MFPLPDLYPAARCNSYLMQELAIGNPGRSTVFFKYHDRSFVLINDVVVPSAFIDDLAEHPMPWNMLFDDDAVLTTREIVGEPFWLGLTDSQRSVLGACLMILIEQGRVVLEFPKAKRKAA
jgi:hypothetical protein